MARGLHGRQGAIPSPDGTRGILAAGEWKILPAEGRDGPVPDWPLVKPKQRELDVWADLWTTPQAFMWEQQRQHIEVALYVRLLCEAERPDTSGAIRGEARRFMEALGLNVPGLFRNRWRIDPTPETEDETEPVKTEKGGGSARDRLRVVGEDV